MGETETGFKASVKKFAKGTVQITNISGDGLKRIKSTYKCESFCESIINKRKKKQHKTDDCQSRFRERGKHFIHSPPVLIVVVILCVLDCVLVIGELILDMHAIKEIDIFGEHCYDGGDVSMVNGTSELKQLDSDVIQTRSRRASSSDYPDPHPIEEQVAHGLHYASIAILAVLLFETILKIYFQGKEFFTHKVEMFDAFVVLTSFVVDLVFLKGITTLPIQQSAYILSYILPWRVLRVVNSLVVAVLDNEHFKIMLVYISKKHVQKHFDETLKEIALVRKQLYALERACIQAGMPMVKINETLLRIVNCKDQSALSKLASNAHCHSRPNLNSSGHPVILLKNEDTKTNPFTKDNDDMRLSSTENQTHL